MASPLTKRALQTIGDSGYARAKKLADIAIKTNVDSSGSPTAEGYQQAIDLLQPFIFSGDEGDALSAQSAVATYSNSLKKISSKEKDQNETVSAFKLQEQDAYFTSFDSDTTSFRNPSDLVGASSEALDQLVLGVINAIDDREARGDSTDTLYTYLGDLQKRADSMRDLRNKYDRGELVDGQSLDGFGYYVDTNPLDGSVRGAALIPVGLAPEGVTSGYRRLESTTKIGNATVPVYAPVQKNSLGEYVARVGDATWSGTGEAALRQDSAGTAPKTQFESGGFSLSDRNLYPVRSNKIDAGQFGRGFVGRDADGNPVEGVYYRGIDGKLYNVDSATLESFKSDPMLASKLEGYVPRLSPSEMQELGREATPISQDRLGRESKIAGLQSDAASAEAAAVEAKGQATFFKTLGRGVGSALDALDTSQNGVAPLVAPPAADVATTAVTGNPILGRAAGFFANRVNRQNKPDAAPTGSTSGGIIESGKQFFRKVVGGN